MNNLNVGEWYRFTCQCGCNRGVVGKFIKTTSDKGYVHIYYLDLLERKQDWTFTSDIIYKQFINKLTPEELNQIKAENL